MSVSDIRLYYSPGSCSLASHILLEECGASFEPVRVLLSAGEHRLPAFLAINPKGRVPALAAGEWILTETPAILRFICDSFPEAKLWPADIRESARGQEWLSWIQSAIDVATSQMSRTGRYHDGGDDAPIVNSGRRKFLELAAEVDRKIGSGPWLLGEKFSPCDAYILVYWLASFKPSAGLNLKSQCPHWAAHAARMVQRASVRRVFEREGLQLP